MFVERSGEYGLSGDVKGDVIIKGEDIVVYGNSHRIAGKMYVPERIL